MQEVFQLLLDKPLAFIITVFGIVFLGLSGLTKLFQIEVHSTNSKRLFTAGLSLVILGIPIYYFGENQAELEHLDAELVKVEYFQTDRGHTCNPPHTIHVRETYKIEGVNGEKIMRIILNSEDISAVPVIYQDSEGHFAVNYCSTPNLKRNIKTMLITNSGKASHIIKYQRDTTDPDNIQKNAPDLSRY